MDDSIIIATLYSYEPIIASVMQLGAKRLILLKDMTPLKEQDDAEVEIRKAVRDYVKVEILKTPVYNIFEVASAVVELIDSFDKNSEIYLNISAGRKTKSLGLMFAGYARTSRIEKIFYVTKESSEMVVLPNMSFSLSEKQKKFLSYFNGPPPQKLRDVYLDMGISRATTFNLLKEFKKKGFMDSDNKLTIAGKLALL